MLGGQAKSDFFRFYLTVGGYLGHCAADWIPTNRAIRASFDSKRLFLGRRWLVASFDSKCLFFGSPGTTMERFESWFQW